MKDKRKPHNYLFTLDTRGRAGNLPDNMVRLKLCFAAAKLRYVGQSEAKLQP
jgi:hypothetical protein